MWTLFIAATLIITFFVLPYLVISAQKAERTALIALAKAERALQKAKSEEEAMEVKHARMQRMSQK